MKRNVALSLIGLLAVGYITLVGWLPGPVIFLVIFGAIFWLFSFFMSLAISVRDRVKSK